LSAFSRRFEHGQYTGQVLRRSSAQHWPASTRGRWHPAIPAPITGSVRRPACSCLFVHG